MGAVPSRVADFVVITGLSGAGRSEAAKHLEDLGWFVIDNLPPALVSKVYELAAGPGSAVDHVALVMGTAEYGDQVADALAQLRRETDSRVRTLFLQARTPVLVRRYEATRRRHPFKESGSLADAIAAERAALEPIAEEADIVIDTSDLNVHELRDRVIELFGGDEPRERMQTRVVSFGYKHGVPLDVDLVFDCRFLPNPHWVDDLRPLTGLDEPVKDYVLSRAAATGFLARLGDLLELLMPAYADEGKAYLTVAFGCTGGRHRSVAISEEVGVSLGQMGFDAGVTHRDIAR